MIRRHRYKNKVQKLTRKCPKLSFFADFSKKVAQKSKFLAPLKSFFNLKLIAEEISNIKRLVCTQCSIKLLTFLYGLIEKMCIF